MNHGTESFPLIVSPEATGMDLYALLTRQCVPETWLYALWQRSSGATMLFRFQLDPEIRVQEKLSDGYADMTTPASILAALFLLARQAERG